MLEAMLRQCPHMARLFWMGYCSHAPLVLMRRDNEFVVLRSAEGARMGDKFGSFAFDLAVHPAYLEIQAACPSVVFQAATDDLKSYARDPLDLRRTFPIASAALEKHAGLRLNQSKSAILLAAGHADLAPEDVPDGVEIKRDGTVVVGAAVGTDQFVQEHLQAIVRQNTRKFDALYLLDPQSALLLLSGCLTPALGYHLQVTPPRLALAAAQAWDAAVDAARMRIASDPALGRAPQVGAALLDLSDKKARLPLKCGGLATPPPCCSAPSPSTPRTPNTPFLSRAPGRGCWRGSSLLLLPSCATSFLLQGWNWSCRSLTWAQSSRRASCRGT